MGVFSVVCMLMLDIPQLRQTYGYDCGAKALQAVLAYYGIEVREDVIMKKVKTTPEGTSVNHIEQVARSYGLQVDSRRMNIHDVKEYLKKKIPVILALQAWTDKQIVDWDKDWVDGHYVVAIGYSKDKVIFEDPSSFERTYITYDELEHRWHDEDTNGKKYLHHGIAVYGRNPVFRRTRLVHMN
jgi:ABC-type bacteriocin/lantibiotic exporter with double-glycine peptidase domain